MKKIVNIISITAALMIFMINVFSQEVCTDSVKTGQIYKILLSNDEWIEGEILSADSAYLKIRQADGTAFKFSKKQIKTITIPTSEDIENYYINKYTGNVKESKKIMKPRLSLSGGLGLTTFERAVGFPASYVVNLEGTLYLSRNAGIRLFVDYNFMGSSDNNSYYEPGYYSYEEGGDISIYIVTVDMLLGSLKPEEKTKQYFTCGIGAFILSESDRKSNSSYGSYSYPGDTYVFAALKIGYGVNHSFTSKVSAGVELLYGTPFQFLGMGLISVKPRISYSISKSFELFIEPQYTFPIGFGDFSGFYASNGYFTIKTGFTLSSF